MTASARSLTRVEAEERATLLEVDRYDITVDLRGLLDGVALASVSTITFRCDQPGASTFVDCVAEVRSATLNGRELDLATVADGRIPLSDLAAENVLVVSATQTDTADGAGILRTVDESDQLVYVWTSFEPDDARRVWACFDQPDLKAPHGFTVLAPESWTVTSNSAPDSVEDIADDEGGRVWRFADTPPLSTYVVVVNAGPFHELREQRGGHSLGLYCRQSLKQFLDRDAAELFAVTEAGLAFFGERFAMPFPQERYDQVFVPNMAGAMENWGCVTWTDAVLYRSTPTHGQRALVASVLLHEMAHMWFGDLVTMRWWDDLWLNEAFASWAATWASVNATAYTDGWATFLAGPKLEGYRVDMGPASHPIRGEVPDVEQATANFDAITYIKGESVLKQLVAYVGEETFVDGLRAYFRDHAWGNTRLADLIAAVGTAAGRDLSEWSNAWFDRAGTDTLTLVGGDLLASGPDGAPARPHRLEIAGYREVDEGLELVGSVAVETSGPRTKVEGLPEADVFLLNDRDLTFAAVRADVRSTRTMIDSAGALPDPLSRALAVSTAWDLLVKGELSSSDLLSCLLGVLRTERSAGVVEPFLALGLRAAEQWTRPAGVPRELSRLARAALELSADPEHRTPALRTLAAAASTGEHFAALDQAAADDTDLAWRILVRRSALGDYDEPAVKAMLERDPDPDASARALGVLAARPDAEAKAEVWAKVFDERSVPVGSTLIGLARCFWRPVDRQLMLPWAHRYLAEVGRLGDGGMLSQSSLVRAMFPTVADEAFLEKATSIAQAPDVNATVRATLLGGADTLSRVLRAQG